MITQQVLMFTAGEVLGVATVRDQLLAVVPSCHREQHPGTPMPAFSVQKDTDQ